MQKTYLAVAAALLSLTIVPPVRADEIHTSSVTLADMKAVSPALEQYTRNALFDGLWSRPELSPRDRCIVTLAVLIARNQTAALPAYLNLALYSGVKPSEISEMITHLAFYSGWGDALSAVPVVRDIFLERGVGPDQLPEVSPELLPLNQAAEAQRATRIEEFGAVAPGLVQNTTDIFFRDLWRRPGLAPRDRSLVTVSALIASGQTAQLSSHLSRAMDNGLTQAQAAEMLNHLAFYAGWPNAFSASRSSRPCSRRGHTSRTNSVSRRVPLSNILPKHAEISMQFGATMWFTEYSISPTELAVALEERRFESLWASEHSHLPMPKSGEWRKEQADVMDPFLTLTAAAMSTKTLKLGTGICLVNHRDPIQTAKLVASIDQLSGKRFLFGIGNGWHEEEMRNHGTALATRHQLVQERVEAMRAIWTQDRAEYHGKFVDFGPMIANPKPVQKPYPPVIVGGAYPYAARRAVQYGDGWYALTAEKYGNEFEFIRKFHDMLAKAGRDRSSCPITICLCPEELDAFAPDQVGALARYEELGMTRCIVGFNSDKREAILPVLDRWAT